MTNPNKFPLPYAITQKLSEARQVLRSYLTRKWVAMTICWLLIVYWLGAAIDYLPARIGSDETPKSVRIAFLCIMAAGSLWLLVGWLLPRLLRRIDNSSLALLIERKHPELANRLITAVQVNQSTTDVSDPAAHDQLFERVLIEADAAMVGVRIDQLFKWEPLRILQVMAGLGITITLIVGITCWSWFAQWNSRLFALSNTPWPRSAVLRVDWLQLPLPTFAGQLSAEQIQIQFEEGLARVPAGSSPRLQVSADAAAPKIPEVCTLHYRSEDGTRGRANLRRIGAPRDGWQQFNLDGPPLDSISNSLSMDIVGLDARLRDLQLKAIEPVVIIEMQLECIYPSYLLDSLSSRPPKEIITYRSGMKIPEGTQCTMIGRCSSPLSKVEYVLDTDSGKDSATELNVREAKIDQQVFRIGLGELAGSQLVEIRLRDQYGLPAEQVLRYLVAVQSDSVPEVQSRLDGIGLAITPRAVLPVRGKVTDDHAIAEVAAEMSLNETVLPRIPLQLADTVLSGEIDLLKLAAEKQIVIQPGVTIGLSVRAKDRYDLAGGEHIGRGQPQQLTVVTDDKLIAVLDRQELELRQRLEQIISELRQMEDVLENLVEQLTELETAAIISPSVLLADRSMLTSTNSALQQDGDGKQADTAAAQRQSMQRLAILKAQQSQLQTDKSRQELAGIVNRIENLRLQLVNNRIDSVDRQQRLQEQVEKPLTRLLAGEYVELDRQMSRLQTAVQSNRGKEPAASAAKSLEQVLEQLELVKQSMLNIEGFNEIVELLRNLRDEQERLLKETEEAQKARVLDDLFK